MNIFYDVSEIEQLNNLEFCNNSTIIYSYPFSISLSVLPNIPMDLKSEQEIVEYMNNVLSPICENTTDVFSKIMVFVGKSNGGQFDPKTEKTSSSRLLIESGLGSEFQKAKGDTRGGSSTISISNGFDVTVVIEQLNSIQHLFQSQKGAGEYFEKAFTALAKQDWNINVRVGMMSDE
jgi:hypothetical protein